MPRQLNDQKAEVEEVAIPQKPEPQYRILVYQFNLATEPRTPGFYAGEVHSASRFGDELPRLLELGAVEVLAPSQE